MNVKKTKMMVISKSEDMQAKIKVDGKQLEQVQQFKYLGRIITIEGKSNKEIEKAKSMFIKLDNIFLYQETFH